MNRVEEGGSTYRDVLEGLLKRARTEVRKAEIEEQLALPDFPEELNYLWIDFWRLRRRVASTGFGVTPISWEAIDAYCRKTGRNYVPWEVQVIEALDDVWLVAASGRTETEG